MKQRAQVHTLALKSSWLLLGWEKPTVRLLRPAGIEDGAAGLANDGVVLEGGLSFEGGVHARNGHDHAGGFDAGCWERVPR